MTFLCRYGTPDGRVLDKVFEGPDAATVRRDLERQGFQIFELESKGFSFDLGSLLPRRRPRHFPPRRFLAFNQELAALLRAGLPLLQALDLMLERLEDPLQREVLEEVRERVRNGEDLSEAFASFGDLFPALYSSSLKAGERSGELESVIRRFIRYQRIVLDIRKKVVSALVYPSVLIGLSATMLIVLSVFVLPKFSQFYEGMGAELPGLTKLTLAISFWLRAHILKLIVVVGIAVFAVRRWARGPTGARTIDRLRLRIPLAGQVIRYFALSEFCRSLATLLAGGIPLLSALETAISATSNAWVASRLEPTLAEVREGQAFHVALEKTAILPPIAVDMIKVGEATGALDEMLSSVADYFDEAVETRIERMLALVEPALLIIMGLLISVILVSIYLPMFGALSQVGG